VLPTKKRTLDHTAAVASKDQGAAAAAAAAAECGAEWRNRGAALDDHGTATGGVEL
jgi:acyl-CoA reductase-like NAD-dependent aldehyde dehydrogenase